MTVPKMLTDRPEGDPKSGPIVASDIGWYELSEDKDSNEKLVEFSQGGFIQYLTDLGYTATQHPDDNTLWVISDAPVPVEPEV